MKELRLLVVDDEPGIRDYLARWLGHQGCEVHTAKDSGEALAKVRAQPGYDVILVDLVMPAKCASSKTVPQISGQPESSGMAAMEGLRLIRQLLALDASLHLIAVTGMWLSAAVQAELADLNVFVCVKPCRNEELLQAVRAAARRSDGSAQADGCSEAAHAYL